MKQKIRGSKFLMYPWSQIESSVVHKELWGGGGAISGGPENW